MGYLSPKATVSGTGDGLCSVNTTKGTQEVTHRRPHAFSSVGMNFANAIAIIISGPFFSAVADRGVGPDDIVTSFPPHSETFRLFQSGCHLKESEVAGVRHWLEFLGGLGALFSG
jgi:hypothetical protein